MNTLQTIPRPHNVAADSSASLVRDIFDDPSILDKIPQHASLRIEPRDDTQVTSNDPPDFQTPHTNVWILGIVEDA